MTVKKIEPKATGVYTQVKIVDYNDLWGEIEVSEKDNFCNVLLTGENGAGKTKFLETAPTPILLLNFDPGGHKCLRLQKEKILIKDFSNDNAINPTQYDEFELFFESASYHDFFRNFATIAIDSYTTFEEIIKNKVAFSSFEESKSKSFDSASKQKSFNNMKRTIPVWNDYQLIGNLIKSYVKRCCNLPCHFILTAHLESKDQGKNQVWRFSSFKSMSNSIPSLMEEQWVVKTTGGERKIVTNRMGTFSARSKHYDKLEVEENPNFKKILEKINFNFENKANLARKGGEKDAI